MNGVKAVKRHFLGRAKNRVRKGGEKINKPLAGKQRKDFKERKTLND